MADTKTDATTMADTPLPPGPGGLGVSRLRHRLRDGVGFYEHMYHAWGDIVSFRMLSHRFCIVFDPALFQEVFVTKKASFEVGPIFTRSGLLNDPSSGLTAEGDALKRTRTLARTSFGAKAMNGYGEIMIERALHAQAGWRDGDTIDLDAEAQTLALDIATNTFFGSDMWVEPRIIKDVLKAIEWSMALVMLPLGEVIRTLPLPQNRHRARAVGALDTALHRAIADARRVTTGRDDLLSYLVNATDEDGIYKPFNDSELRDMCFILLFAGHETTGTAITWSLYHLSRNPDARKRLEHELDEVLGNRPPTAADYRNLMYTRAVLDENLRLTPPLYVTGRTALEDCTIGDYHIPKGTIVQLCWRIAHLSEQYFPAADTFKPERWLEPQPPDRPTYAYVPFGGGDHSCIGAGFGKMATVLTLATLCQRWQFDVISPEFPDVNTTALFRLKHGLPVTLRARQP